MSTLLDRVYTSTLLPPAWLRTRVSASDARRYQKQLCDVLSQAVVFSINNVTEFVFAQTEQERWAATDFPNLAPPFPVFWMETRRPSTILSRENPDAAVASLPRAWAVAIEAKDAAWLAPYQATQAGRQQLITEHLWDRNPHAGPLIERLPEARWLWKGDAFIEMQKGEVIGPLATWYYLLDADGRALAEPSYQLQNVDGSALTADAAEAFFALIYPVCMALSFLHCKNVVVQDQVPPPALSKAHARKHGRPLVEFHTLEIGGMTRVLRDEAGPGRGGIKRALHICRGHFAEYNERPLFGRFRGLVWRPAHVRGSVKEGITVKDYAVKPPRADSDPAEPPPGAMQEG